MLYCTERIIDAIRMKNFERIAESERIMTQMLITKTKNYGLDSFALKMIAMITMVIDHIGAILFPQYEGFRIIGRIAFPIFCFLLVEGALHTHDIKKYLTRLFLFALISEVPFDFAFYGGMNWNHQNVMFTLLLGLSAIALMKKYPGYLYGFLISIAAILLAEFANTDYAGGGVLLILIFYFFKDSYLSKSIFSAVLYIFCYGGIEVYAILAQIFWSFYNGKPGKKCKYLFYWFYPVHLAVLLGIKMICF